MESPFRIRRMSEVTSEEISWLWNLRIPYGAVTVLEGHPGLGKSSVTYDLAARCSTGKPMPGEQVATEPEGVLLFQGEDVPGSMMLPRLAASGANLDLIFVPDCGSKSLVLPDDIGMLETFVDETKARLIVIDPVGDFIGGSVNSEQVVRRALQPLADLANRRKLAVILVRHLNKQASASLIRGGAGSIAIFAAARSVLRIIADPAADHANGRLVIQAKSNLAQARAFSFETRAQHDVIGIDWGSERSDFVPENLDSTRAEHSKLLEAKFAIYAILRDGALPANEVYAIAARAGIAKRTLERAKQEIGVFPERQGNGKSFVSYWVMPTNTDFFRQLYDQDIEKLANNLFHGVDDRNPT